MAPLPIIKLAFLLVKQVSKPVAKKIAASAQERPLFRNWVCAPIGQWAHFMEVKVRMAGLNLGQGRVTRVPRLAEDKAVQQGSELLSEIIIFGTAMGLLTFEYNRSSDKEAVKQEQLKADRELIKSKILEMELQLERQRGQIQHLTSSAIQLEGEAHKKSLAGMKQRLLGEPEAQAAKVLTDIMEEKPREIKALRFSEDVVEEDSVSPEALAVGPVQKVVEPPVLTPVQKLVEARYARPPPLLVEVDTEVQGQLEVDKTGPASTVASSVEFVLQNLFPVGREDNRPSTAGERPGLVTAGLGHLLQKAES